MLKDLDQNKENASTSLPLQARELLKTHLVENQDLVRDLKERLRLSHEEMELQSKRRGEVEKMLMRRDQAYEELLGLSTQNFLSIESEC